MRILSIAPTPYFSDRGCHVQIYEEASALAGRGHAVTLATYGHGRDAGSFGIRRIRRIWAYRKTASGPSLFKLAADPMLLQVVHAEALRFKPDVLHAHLHEGAAIGMALRPLLGVPVAAEFQGSLSVEMFHHGWPRLGRWLSPVERWAVSRADAVVTQTGAFASELAARWGSDPARTFVAGTGVDTAVFHPGPSSEPLRARWNLPDPSKVVAYLGILSAHQGVDTLLAAAARVVEKEPQARFLVMGYPRQKEYEAKALGLGIAHACRFTGRIDYREAPEFLRLAAVGVSAKGDVTEGNAKLCNYMASGLAVAATDTPAHREILQEAALFAPVGDAAALADRILVLLSDAPLCRRLGEAARARAQRALSWDLVAGRLETAFDAAVRHRRSSF